MALTWLIYGAPLRDFGGGLHDAHDEPLGEENITSIPVFKREGGAEAERSGKHETSPSKSLRRTPWDGHDIGEVTSSESAGEALGFPRFGASGTLESDNSMTSLVVSEIVITS